MMNLSVQTPSISTSSSTARTYIWRYNVGSCYVERAWCGGPTSPSLWETEYSTAFELPHMIIKKGDLRLTQSNQI